MTSIISTNITSPLGMTTEQNYQAVKSGCSALMRFDSMWNLPEPFAASLFSDEQMEELKVDGFTRFESVVLHSVKEALTRTSFDVSSPRVLFVLSTTKGNVEMLGDEVGEDEYPGVAARRIADALGITTEPVVVCNACISGVAAQILAQRMLNEGLYSYAIVAGAEVQSKFIVSGFQSFKAVTDEICRPFDIERLGLNLGEGAGTIILSSQNDENGDGWCITDGCVRNDAYHLSSPHPQGEGYYLALSEVIGDAGEIATLGVHGTATMYNDQMESKAIERAGLSDVPLTSLKGYFGHTMGAAGVIETIITMCATEDGIVLGARGFEEIGVSGKVNISAESRKIKAESFVAESFVAESREIKAESFVKMLSGFGGCNGALRLSKCAKEKMSVREVADLQVLHEVRITPSEVYVDGEKLETSAEGKALLTEVYKSQIGGYAKFYKMDVLTRLTFVATELLLGNDQTISLPNDQTPKQPSDQTAVILFNRSSSIVADSQYFETIRDDENYYPSPAAFLYTLPNLTTGEIAIKHQITGETSFYILPEKNEALMENVIRASFQDKKTNLIIGGWVDCPDENEFEAHLKVFVKVKG